MKERALRVASSELAYTGSSGGLNSVSREVEKRLRRTSSKEEIDSDVDGSVGESIILSGNDGYYHRLQ